MGPMQEIVDGMNHRSCAHGPGRRAAPPNAWSASAVEIAKSGALYKNTGTGLEREHRKQIREFCCDISEVETANQQRAGNPVTISKLEGIETRLIKKTLSF